MNSFTWMFGRTSLMLTGVSSSLPMTPASTLTGGRAYSPGEKMSRHTASWKQLLLRDVCGRWLLREGGVQPGSGVCPPSWWPVLLWKKPLEFPAMRNPSVKNSLFNATNDSSHSWHHSTEIQCLPLCLLHQIVGCNFIVLLEFELLFNTHPEHMSSLHEKTPYVLGTVYIGWCW